MNYYITGHYQTITIRNDVYNKLLSIKSNESFSDLLERLIEKRSTEVIRSIRDKMELDSQSKKAMLNAAYDKRS